MGGCVSMDDITNKFNSKTKGSAKIGATEIHAVSGAPIGVPCQALVVPVFGFDNPPETLSIIDAEAEDKAKVEGQLKEMLDTPDVKNQLKKAHVVDAKAKEGETKLTTGIFVYIDSEKTGADRIKDALNNIFKLAEEKKLAEITIPKLHKDGGELGGLNMQDAVNEIVQLCKLRFEKDEGVIKKINFASSDDAYIEALASKLKSSTEGEGEGGMFSKFSTPAMPSMPNKLF